MQAGYNEPINSQTTTTMYRTKRPADDDNVITVPIQKPRARELNETLLRRKGGPMKNPKDVSRSKEKQALQRMNFED